MQANHPPKEVVRRYIQGRIGARPPPPSPEQIKRELGWHLEAAANAKVREGAK